MNLRFMIYDLLLGLLLLGGCSQPQATPQKPPMQRAGSEDRPHEADQAIVPNPQPAIMSSPAATGGRNLQLPAGFVPVKIGILPLTELFSPSDTSQGGKLSVFVVLLDAFGSQLKAPGVLRFELYEYIPRSAQPKGQRLTLWPDVDLTNPAQNNKYWRDFLRAYEFVLDTQARRDKTYILEVTCMCPDGKRLSAEYVLKSSP